MLHVNVRLTFILNDVTQYNYYVTAVTTVGTSSIILFIALRCSIFIQAHSDLQLWAGSEQDQTRLTLLQYQSCYGFRLTIIFE